MNRDIFLWIAIAGLVGVIGILLWLLRKRNPVEVTLSDETDNITLEEPTTLIPEKDIIRISNELAVTAHLVDRSMGELSERLRYFLYPYIYLHNYIANNRWGKDTERFITSQIKGAIVDEPGRFHLTAFDAVMRRTVFLKLLAESRSYFPNDKENDFYIFSVIKRTDLISDEISDALFLLTEEPEDIADERGVSIEEAKEIQELRFSEFVEAKGIQDYLANATIMIPKLILSGELDDYTKYINAIVLPG